MKYKVKHTFKKLFVVISLIATSFITINAQSVQEIMADTSYVCAEGVGRNVNMADRDALEKILQQIKMTIIHDSELRIKNQQQDTETANTSVEFQSIMKTYATATINNTQCMMVENGPTTYRVFRYVKKSEIDRIFTSRKAKVKEQVNLAHESLKEMKINDALRYYYWASVLTQSLRYPEEMKITDMKGEEHIATVWIPAQITMILQNLSAEIINKDGNIYDMAFFYYGKPVASVDFTYFDGKSWSCNCTATDGKGQLEMRPGYSPEGIKLKYEYEFNDDTQTDNEVKNVLEAMGNNTPQYNHALVNIPIKDRIDKNSEEYAELTSLENAVPDLGVETKQATIDECNASMLKVIDAIRNKKYESIETLFTSEGYDVFTRLINYGNAKIIGEPKLNYSSFGSDTYCRSLHMNFTFTNNRKFVEDVVFVFNQAGLIDNISFSLGKVATLDILASAEEWSEEAKNVLINFLETYKTAFALRRKDYLNSIFADDALIIVGKVVTKSMRKLDGTYYNNRIKLNKQTKEQYIKNLGIMFNSREYINIKFANNIIKKMGKGGEVYSIQIKQDFFSSSYGDSGYLFILVDLNKPNEPTIRVRAWQEFPDPEWGKFGPEIF